MFAGFPISTSGGGLSNESAAHATAGPIHVAGLTFAPKSSQDQITTLGVVALMALGLVWAFTRR